MLTCEAYLSPKSLNEAFAAVAENMGRYRFVAGATDLLPWAREGRAGDVHVPVLIDIAGLPELRDIRRSGNKLWIGGAVQFQRFLDHPDLIAYAPAMPDAAIWFADQQLRESATIGGNIMNASPAGDGIPPLLAANASVEMATLKGPEISRRRIPLDKFLLGPGRVAAEADEILVGIECDALSGYGGAFEKVGHRRSLVISVACVSALVKMDRTGRRFEDVRLAIGGVGPVALRMSDFEQALSCQDVGPNHLKDLLPSCEEFVRSRSRQDYRKHVAKGFVVNALVRAMAKAGAPADLCDAMQEVANG